VYDASRNTKFDFIEPIVRIPGWHALAAISVGLAALLLGLFYINSRTLAARGRSFLAVIVYATATVAVWVVYEYSQQYLTVTSVLIGSLLIVGMLGVIAVLLAEAHEWAEAHWGTVRERLFTSVRMPDQAPAKVSIHVPAYNEPSDMLIETLDALAALDYPDYEVLVIDNNTPDESVWRPVAEHCCRLGSHFRFFHVDPLAGFKAGALNFALRETAPDADIVAVIDSDYVVSKDWLKDLVPVFDNPRMAIVQAPQDYRDARDGAYKALCYAEYRGFFCIGMITRNERNAIIQHGTMTMVRRQVLEEVGGWAEWCITEDAELGLRIFERGYEASYVPHTYGRGLMPDTFIDYKKQRYRWAYGAMQILKAHARALFGARGSGLSSGQRYHFVAGWLPWVADGFNLLFNIAALGWSVAMVAAPQIFDPPLMMFSVLPLSLFTFKLVKLAHLYRECVGANLRQTLAAALAGLALAHTIGVATVRGLLTRHEPFFRTPKQSQRQALLRALSAAREEILMMMALWLAAWAVHRIPLMDSPDMTVWQVALMIQSVPYAASVLVSLISAAKLPARLIGEAGVMRHVASTAAAVSLEPAGAYSPTYRAPHQD
jgi:cellulose synthase/poly-beta-1,6-N-acetylglucosamine synthase-like glycosyltransferase